MICRTRKVIANLVRSTFLCGVCVMVSTSVWGGTPEVKMATGPLPGCLINGTSGLSNLLPAAADSGSSLSGGFVLPDKSSFDGAYVYQSGFYASKWGGSLKKFAVTLNSDGIPDISTPALWDASDILTGYGQLAPNPLPDNRKIYTVSTHADKSLATIEFTWADLNAEQKTILHTSPLDEKNDGLGEKRLNFLRGARGFEQDKVAGIFRSRERVLGDIINSSPLYVGAPAPNVQGASYQKFYNAHQVRSKAVYVGANDGMLHAFDAASGQELFAYIPSFLFSTLNQLARPDYVHRPYVDAALTASEALVAGTWRTVLASGMGGGAQGVFGLDVTNPADFGNGKGVIFEFSDSDDPDMGNVLSAPVIAKFKMGTVQGVPEYKYFVVVPSGFNNYKKDGTGKYDAAASGALFLLSLDKALATPWKLNVNYFKFKTPIKDVAKQNSLSSPSFAVGNNGAVRFAYAGDLQGNLWRFDFSGLPPWPKVRTSDTPVFFAKDEYGTPQPITMQPRIIFAPGGGYVVLFGTGKFIEEADTEKANFKVQSFYGIYDTTHNQDSVTGRSQLALRTLTKENDGGLDIAGNEFTYGVSAGNKKGWYFDFLESDKTGERSVANPVTAFGKLFFNSLTIHSKPCTQGSGRSYFLDALTGLTRSGEKTGFLSEFGLIGSPLLLDLGAVIGDSNSIGKAVAKKKYAILNVGTGGLTGAAASANNQGTVGNSVTLPARRFSWREVLNWQELHDAANKK